MFNNITDTGAIEVTNELYYHQATIRVNIA